MGAKLSFDPVTRIIQITQAPDGNGEISIDVKVDLYSDGKEDYLSNLNNFTTVKFPIEAVGGRPLPGSKVQGTTYFLDSTWKIRPYESTHKMIINGNLFSVDGSSFITPTIGSYNVIIEYSVSNLVDSTIQQLEQIEYGTFQGGVWLDEIDGFLGIDGLKGNAEFPVKLYSDGKTIALSRGFKRFYIIGNFTFGATNDLERFEIIGESKNKTTITLTSGVNTNLAEFVDAEITGVASGALEFRFCHLEMLSGIGGTVKETTFYECDLEQDVGETCVTIANSATKAIHFIDCQSAVAGQSTPTVDVNGSVAPITFRQYSGGLQLKNIIGGQDISLDFDSGQLIIDSSCTNGTLTVRGNCKVTNNSTGGFVVNDETSYTLLQNLTDMMTRMVGLSHENKYIDQVVYNNDGDSISSRIRLYSNANDVGTINNVIATYRYTASYNVTTQLMENVKIILESIP